MNRLSNLNKLKELYTYWISHFLIRTKENATELTSSSISGSIKETKLSTSFWLFNHCNKKKHSVNALQNTKYNKH